MNTAPPYRAPLNKPAALWWVAAILLLIAVFNAGLVTGYRWKARQFGREIQHCVCSMNP